MKRAYAETLSERERRRGRIFAYCACYFGCLSEVMMDSSAIVILYIGMLGGSSTMIMLSTSFYGLSSMLFTIPAASEVAHFGMKRSVGVACISGCAGLLMAASAAWCGRYGAWVALAGCMIYCLQRTFYGASWYPMLDAFLRKQDRGSFFGTMRYSYMILSGLIFYFVGVFMGAEPPVILMQIFIGCMGLMLLGRWYCMSRFPEDPREQAVKLDMRRALGISLRNSRLTCYSVYVCLLSLAYTSLVPLTLVYLKQYVKLESGRVQIFSTVGILGSILGYFVYGKLLKWFKIKKMELLVHLIFLSSALTLALVCAGARGFIWIVGAAYFMASFAASAFLCNHSTELLALARPGNKAMAMAFAQTYLNIGVTAGRIGTALLLGSNLLAPVWTMGGAEYCNYQALFLFYGAVAAVALTLFPILPAVVPKHHDFYEPVR